jgi:hypothetical protein
MEETLKLVGEEKKAPHTPHVDHRYIECRSNIVCSWIRKSVICGGIRMPRLCGTLFQSAETLDERTLECSLFNSNLSPFLNPSKSPKISESTQPFLAASKLVAQNTPLNIYIVQE